MMISTILLILLVTNLIAFVLMGVDKRRAKSGAWRIPEKTLFLAAACFGGLGGTAGMFFFHHKTKHWYFRIGFPALLVIQTAALLYVLTRLAA